MRRIIPILRKIKHVPNHQPVSVSTFPPKKDINRRSFQALQEQLHRCSCFALGSLSGSASRSHGQVTWENINGVWSAISLESVNRNRNPHGLMTMPPCPTLGNLPSLDDGTHLCAHWPIDVRIYIGLDDQSHPFLGP